MFRHRGDGQGEIPVDGPTAFPVRHVFVQKTGMETAFGEGGLLQDGDQVLHVGRHPEDGVVLEAVTARSIAASRSSPCRLSLAIIGS